MTGLLEIDRLVASYGGGSQVLFGVSLSIAPGEVVTLLGRNGMGKSTTVRAIMGLVPERRGRVLFDGTDLVGRPPESAARAGIGLVPEGRQVFPSLTVRENLVATARRRPGARWTLERVCAMFPRLAERLPRSAASLSGGEQQMLAIGRALMTNPRCLVLDEATEGLAPAIRTEIWRCLAALKQQGMAILVIDKNLRALNRFADRHYLIEKGRIVWDGTPAELGATIESVQRRLAVG